MNKNWNGAVRKAGSGVGSALRRMHVWQKAGLVLCLVSWLASLGTGAFCRRTADSLTDQGFASRWSRSGDSAQVSCFFAESALLSEDDVSSMYAGLMTDLQTASIALSETQIENGASLVDTCYIGMGTAEITGRGESLSVSAIGVGGDFFNFHPLDLMSGYYFSQDDLMQDRILMDDATAWRMFGSPYVVGLSVEIGGVPHYIAGVFRRPEKKFYKEAGMGDYLIYMSYDSLCRYTEAGYGGGSTDTSDDEDFEMSDVYAPEIRVETAAPETTACAGGAVRDAFSAAAGDAPGLARDVFSAAAGDASVAVRDAFVFAAGTTVYASEISRASAVHFLAVDDTLGDGEDFGDNGSGAEDDPEEGDSEGSGAADDDYIPSGGSGGTGYYGGDEDEREPEEVNRNRICCYEAVLPEPVSGFALRLIRSRVSQAGYSSSQVSVVDNTSRYGILRLASLAAQPGLRSMQTAAIRYPYWENVALAWEDVLIPIAVLTLILRWAPALFLLYLFMWYMTHKSWTVIGGLRLLQDRIYERQSERIYGKRPSDALPDGGNEAGLLETGKPETDSE